MFSISGLNNDWCQRVKIWDINKHLHLGWVLGHLRHLGVVRGLELGLDAVGVGSSEGSRGGLHQDGLGDATLGAKARHGEHLSQEGLLNGVHYYQI